MPAATEAELRELYGRSETLLEAALRRRPQRAGSPQLTARATPASEHFASAADLFEEIARQSGNAQLEAAIANLNDRLAAVRLAEDRVLEKLDDELAELRSAFAKRDLPTLKRAISAYHRRRERFTPSLLVAARLPHEEG